MARRLLLNKLISKNSIPDEIKYIKDSNQYYISDKGNVYVDYGNDLFYPKINQIKQGYLYCDIIYGDKCLHKRVHRLVAEAFIPNPNNYSVVGHKDNNKLNPNVHNLYWTSLSENTQKAFDDGLNINAKGYEDNQSFPIYVFTIDKKYYKDYGSISLAAQDLGISKSTIARQCNGTSKGKPRCGYYFRYQKDYQEKPSVL